MVARFGQVALLRGPRPRVRRRAERLGRGRLQRPGPAKADTRTLEAPWLRPGAGSPQVKLCAEVLRFGWVLFHHIGPGAWWTAGKLRALPAPPLPRCPA